MNGGFYWLSTRMYLDLSAGGQTVHVSLFNKSSNRMPTLLLRASYKSSKCICKKYPVSYSNFLCMTAKRAAANDSAEVTEIHSTSHTYSRALRAR